MNNNGNKWGLPVAVLLSVLLMAGGLALTITGKGNVSDPSVVVSGSAEVGVEEEEGKTEDATENVDFAKDFSAIYGGWESAAYYEFREDGTYGWYKDSQDLTNNYYEGTYTVLRGADACEHLDIPFENVVVVMSNSSGAVDMSDIYCITCYPTYLISGGIDKSDTLKGGHYDLLFVVTGENSAQGKNMSNMDSYYFTKIK